MSARQARGARRRPRHGGPHAAPPVWSVLARPRRSAEARRFCPPGPPLPRRSANARSDRVPRDRVSQPGHPVRRFTASAPGWGRVGAMTRDEAASAARRPAAAGRRGHGAPAVRPGRRLAVPLHQPGRCAACSTGPVEALVGRDIWEEFPEAVGSPFEELYRRVAATGQPRQHRGLVRPAAASGSGPTPSSPTPAWSSPTTTSPSGAGPRTSGRPRSPRARRAAAAAAAPPRPRRPAGT